MKTTSAEQLSALREQASVRLNVDLDWGLHHKLRQLALDLDRSVADVIRELIEQAVRQDSSE